jgi:hypothetical protein
LADKAADNVSKRAQVDMNFAMSLRDPNAYAKAVEEETRRLQGQAGRPSTTGASAYQLSPEAQKALQQYGGK